MVPLEMQPQSEKRQTRAAFDKSKETSKIIKKSYAVSRRPQQSEQPAPKVVEEEESRRRGPGRPRKDIQSPILPKVKPRAQETSPPKLRNRSSSHAQKSTAHDGNVEAMQHALDLKRQQLFRLTHRQKPPTARANGHDNSDDDEDDDDVIKVESTEKRSALLSASPPSLQKVKFVVRRPRMAIASRDNIPLPRSFKSFDDFLTQDPDLIKDRLNDSQIQDEARKRLKVSAARRRGGLLNQALVQTRPDPQKQVPRQYAHQDHLLGHVVHFQKLLRQEHRDHVRRARDLALEAKKFVETRAQMNRVKTKEEVEQEQMLLMRNGYRSVIRDFTKLWAAVETYVLDVRTREKQKREDEENTKRLDMTLDKTQTWLDASMRHDGSQYPSDAEETGSDDNSADSSDSENMSGSGSDSEGENDASNTELMVEDEAMTQEQLQAKYGDLPEPTDPTSSAPLPHADDKGSRSSRLNLQNGQSEQANGESVSESAIDADMSLSVQNEASEAEAVKESADDEPVEATRRTRATQGDTEDEIMLDEDESDSTDYSTTMDSEDEESSGSESDEGPTLASFFGPRLQKKAEENNGTASDIEENDTIEIDPQPNGVASVSERASPVEDYPENSYPEALPNGDTTEANEEYASRDISTEASVPTTATKASVPESESSVEVPPSSPLMRAAEDVKAHLRTPVPHLFRGTLRVYQHEGLDWLADLYDKGRNGILADEMGLGKTIQTIALLAHLAVQHEVWGPHLIVVPTSVMLNWEMEFKKFCPGFKILTYYGTQEERRAKRKGWTSSNAFNVCITSYQLVLKDASIFKRRAWHYMVLDEAHNIKNFRSARWQTMMSFNTRARLLLTGTPLQNNIRELWSLLFFLHYNTDSEQESFADLDSFMEWFGKSANTILEHGRQDMSEEEKSRITKLHKIIRPFLLRRLKKDVEKEMPLKYEHVELCRLSKRQRQLYDGFMSLSTTRDTLSSGNYLSIINALMQLRKVCNHPDLFETRPIMTSLAIPRSEPKEWAPHEHSVRRLLNDPVATSKLDLDFMQLCPISRESISANEVMERTRLFTSSNADFLQIREVQRQQASHTTAYSGRDIPTVLSSLKNIRKTQLLDEFDRTMYIDTYRHRGRPLLGRALLEKIAFGTTYDRLSQLSQPDELPPVWESSMPVSTLGLVSSVEKRALTMEPFVQRFACITPLAAAADLTEASLSPRAIETVRSSSLVRGRDPFHEARMKLSIGFPDKRLLQYDCGKLQRLDRLLRQLSTGGHRALIFTQMTKVLDILEQFLNIHGHRYLRLDGATKIEQRQILTDRFNNDPRILCFILSSRSGGLGINLTGADTVIFYDLDWNPAMDRQCTDRAHRIGQTRDVHIYRLVSEHTIEANILRKASQKQMLDDVVIQEGDFTTDFFNQSSYTDMLPDDDEAMASAAMDRILGNEQIQTAFEGAEDKEDVAAAKVAVLEDHADDEDFDEGTTQPAPGSKQQSLGPYAATNAALAEAVEDEWTQVEKEVAGTVDSYMIRFMRRSIKDAPLQSRDKSKKKKRRGDPHMKVRR